MSGRDLTPTQVQAILQSARGGSAEYEPYTVENLRRWLHEVLERAVRRAGRKPLTPRDVNRLTDAYAAFADVISELQDRNDPPPMIPVLRGATDWQNWIDGQVFGFKRGRPPAHDWVMISQLLALYEVTSEKAASAAQEHGPTMRFLCIALSALKEAAPEHMEDRFSTPDHETLKKRMPTLIDPYISGNKESLRWLKEALFGNK